MVFKCDYVTYDVKLEPQNDLTITFYSENQRKEFYS